MSATCNCQTIRRLFSAFALLLSAALHYADVCIAQSADPTLTEDGRIAVEEKLISTAFYTITADIRRGLVYRWQYGGGLATLGDGYLLATRQGLLYHFNWTEADGLRKAQLPYRVPLNFEDFEADVPDSVNKLWFRVADVATSEYADGIRILVSHHAWRKKEQCAIARISMLEGTETELLDGLAAEWRILYETVPCLPIASGNRGFPFAGNHVGGRLLVLDDSQLLVGFGDHAHDGWANEPVLPQDPAASFGKTVLINLDTGSAEIFTTGHRVPSGLYADSVTGNVWLTEHGPQGGDELNLLARGANYGWPLVTYGTADGMDHWPLSKRQGEHDGFRGPMYSWVPSIGISNLIVVDENSQFPLWQGDLLVSSLRDRSIWRVRVREQRVVYGERIELGTRIRDLLQGHDGRIVIWTDEGELISLERHHNTARRSD